MTLAYIVELLQGFVDFLDETGGNFNEDDLKQKVLQLKEVVGEFSENNPKLSSLLFQVLDEIEKDKKKFLGKDISVIINEMRYAVIDKEIERFADKWFIPYEDVKYEALNYKDGELANENKLKDKADYTAYKKSTKEVLQKFKFRKVMIDEFRKELMPEISPLLE